MRPGEATPARLEIDEHPPQSVDLVFDASAPACRLDLAGTIARQTPDERRRPYLELPQLSLAVEIRIARAYLPNNHASAEALWLSTGGESRIHLAPGYWRQRDLSDAAAALRWLETLPRLGGRPADPEADALKEMVNWAREYLQRHDGATPDDIGRPELLEVSGLSASGLDNRMWKKHVTLKKIRRALREL